MVQYILPAILLTIAVFALPSFIPSELEGEPEMMINTVNPNQPEELGAVNWQRNFEQSFAEAERIGKPVFILFQEVPGCSTCRNYGNNVLSHPLIVEAIETLFVPIVVYNNKGGKDAEMKEIIVDVPTALPLMLSGFAWPAAAIKELLSGELTAKDEEIPISPR